MPSDPIEFIDVSQIVADGVTTYKGLPAPLICDYLSREQSRSLYDEGTEFHIGQIEMVANSGTYVDAPFHRYAGAIDISELRLASLANLDGVLFRAPSGTKAIDATLFHGQEVGGKAVLIQTGWSDHWNTAQYFEDHPYLTEDAALFLKEQAAVLVGIDSLNIDDTNDGCRPVHSHLLGAGIPIVEHLTNLQALPERDFRFFAVPAKVKGLGSFPVRAFAMVNGA
jgi:kynurenine formamidase